MISTNIIQQATDMKSLMGRAMTYASLERAVRWRNGILAETERLAGLERETTIRGLVH